MKAFYKIKIVMVLLNMFALIGLVGFSVWATTIQTVAVSNVVRFTSDHVYATVTGTVGGAASGSFNNYGPYSTYITENGDELEPWAIGDAVEFEDENELIVITISMENDSNDESFSFELTNQMYSAFNGINLDDTNIDRAVIFSNDDDCHGNHNNHDDETYTNQVVVVEPNGIATISITLKINNTHEDVVDFNNAFCLMLRCVEDTED